MYSNIKGQEGKIGNLPDFDLFLSWPLGGWKGYINITVFFFLQKLIHVFLILIIYLAVNDGSGKSPAYRGLIDAVKSIVRSNGIKGLYQVQLKYDDVHFRVLPFV